MTKKIKGLVLDKIVEIKDIGMTQTYDFTIPKTHCFFSNGILVHNSLEEACDSCLLVFWEHYYDSTKPFNDYEITIAKQRNGATGLLRVKFYPQYYRFEEFEKNKEVEKVKDIFGGREL